MKTRPRPKTKLPKLVEIVPNMYPDFFLVTCLENLEKLVKNGFTGLLFSMYSFIALSRGWQRVAEGDMANCDTLMVRMHLLCQRSGH